jgi:hypothetical protein
MEDRRIKPGESSSDVSTFAIQNESFWSYVEMKMDIPSPFLLKTPA